ncbi:hypothetical protein QFC22_000823 [Naganishia vaughanmartiniae]|uniref:Uncharacterized protein n=1 Tax=Naganishia vaughanmartiniae TaxID=1424756 RepID=A0ACC2XJ35_9TREE|nr:hypothetical protein QFC22_000823 [Naganishia vaughanmartiniae]
MSADSKILFQFSPEISQEDYRKLWQTRLQKTREKFNNLERLRDDTEIESYLDDLNEFDLLVHGEVRGDLWHSLQPKADFRQEGANAKKAIIALESEVRCSAAIAKNLAKFEQSAQQSLDDDAQRFLEAWKRDLNRNGATLSDNERRKFIHLSTQIQATELEYFDNIGNDTSELELDVGELCGVPDDYLKSHISDPVTGKVALKHKAADTDPILEYCRLQATREKVFIFTCSTASQTNGPVLKRLLNLRAQKAKLLGYNNWAEYQVEDTMMKTVDNVGTFMKDVYGVIRSRSDHEKAQIIDLLRAKHGVEPRAWDMKYGESLLKSHLLGDFELSETRQYFNVDRVFPALLRIVERLFNLRFEKVDTIKAWHPTVTASEVYDVSQGREILIGRVFFDLFPREGKLDGASAWLVRGRVPGKRLAEIVLNANLPEQPSSCMAYIDVRYLLHELGHCVHNLVGPHRYVRFSGMGETQQDFVEAPSQMLELWLNEYKLFDFAINDKGKVIPEEILRRLIAADGIGRGLALRGQWILMKYALDLHTTVIEDEEAIFQVVANVHEKYGTFPVTHRTTSHLSFYHMGASDYASITFSYLHANAICHDIFQEFKRGGDIMDKEVAARYRKLILEKIGSQDAGQAVAAFLGREYNMKAFNAWLDEAA